MIDKIATLVCVSYFLTVSQDNFCQIPSCSCPKIRSLLKKSDRIFNGIPFFAKDILSAIFSSQSKTIKRRRISGILKCRICFFKRNIHPITTKIYLYRPVTLHNPCFVTIQHKFPMVIQKVEIELVRLKICSTMTLSCCFEIVLCIPLRSIQCFGVKIISHIHQIGMIFHIAIIRLALHRSGYNTSGI